MNTEPDSTSTERPLWQIECFELKNRGRQFSLRDVVEADHRAFVSAFAMKFGLSVKFSGATAIFKPENPN
jgi:hypothetical protein